MNNPYKKDSIRGQAAESLGYLADERAVLPLIEALKNESLIIRYDAVFALGELGDARALPALEHIAATDTRTAPIGETIQQAALDAISRIQAAI